MSADSSPYSTLLEKIAALGAKQDERFGDQLQCKKGCFSCCRPPDSFFQVEAAVLEQAVAQVAPSVQKMIEGKLADYVAGARELCPLLDEEEGGCQVYDARPSICRTHGYALWFRSATSDEDADHESDEPNRAEALSWCELNFQTRQPTKEIAFDVERLNAMLSLMTQLQWGDQPPRRSLVEIIQAGLSTTADGAET